MTRPSPVGFLVALISVAIAAASPSAWPLEARATVDHRSEYTTNSGRAADDEVAEWIHSPGATFSATESTASLDLDANYRYQRRIYTDSDFSNEDITTGSANVLWRAIPNRLDFFSRNTRSLSTKQAVDPENPDNRQVVSNSTVGSSLRFQPRRGDEFRLTYAYDIDTRDSTNDDSRSHTGTASYALGLSANRIVTLQGSYAQNSYDNRDDANTMTATLGYSESRSDLTLDVRAGYSSFDGDNRKKITGGVYNASVTWERSSQSSMSFRASRSINDQASTFAFGSRPNYDATLPENSANNEAFTEDRADLSLNQTLGANQLSLSVFASKQEYKDAQDDNKRVGARAGLSRNLTRATTLSTSVSFTNSKFDDQNDEQDETSASVTLNHLVGRRLSVYGGGSYLNRDARTTDSYDEWRFWVGLQYALFGAR